MSRPPICEQRQLKKTSAWQVGGRPSLWIWTLAARSGHHLHRTPLRVSNFQTLAQSRPSCEPFSGLCRVSGICQLGFCWPKRARVGNCPQNRLTRRSLLHAKIENPHTKGSSAQRRPNAVPYWASAWARTYCSSLVMETRTLVTPASERTGARAPARLT